jgi:hypothetical protein
MNEKLDLRTDARWFKSFGAQGSEQFRVAQGLSFDVGKTLDAWTSELPS